MTVFAIMGTENLVVVVEVVTTPSGGKALGGTFRVAVEDAIDGVRADRYKHPLHARGVVPEEWGGPGVKRGEEAEAIEEHGGNIDGS